MSDESITTTPQPATACAPPPQDKIIPAFIKASAELGPIVKDRKVDFINNKGKRVRYDFANVNDILAAVRDAFLPNGLMVFFNLLTTERGIHPRVTVIHESTQKMVWEDFFLPYQSTGPQDIVSLTTYATRIALCSALGIPLLDGDDDGKRAQDSSNRSQQQSGSAQTARVVQQSESLGDQVAGEIKREMDEIGCTADELRAAMLKDGKLPAAIVNGNPGDWPRDWGSRVRKWLDKQIQIKKKNDEQQDAEQGGDS